MTPSVTSFQAGDPVPPHIIDCEAARPGAERPSMVFLVDAHVVELDGLFWVLGCDASSPAIHLSGQGYYSVFAPTKDVKIVTGTMNLGVTSGRG